MIGSTIGHETEGLLVSTPPKRNIIEAKPPVRAKRKENFMIERYSRPEMANIWSEENKYRAWLEVEILADEAWAELGEIPKEDVANC